jgi:anti-anti-sigma factor
MQFILKSRQQDDVLVFSLSGALDYEGARTLKERFLRDMDNGAKRFVLNMDGLKLIASYSLSTILKMSYLAKKADATLSIVCPPGNVWDVFYVLEIGKVIPMFPTEDEFWKSIRTNEPRPCGHTVPGPDSA